MPLIKLLYLKYFKVLKGLKNDKLHQVGTQRTKWIDAALFLFILHKKNPANYCRVSLKHKDKSI